MTTWTALRVLSNPRQAGVYDYECRRYRRTVERQKRDPEQGVTSATDSPAIPNGHPGDINWEQYQQNLKLPASNGRGYKLVRGSPPREGTALL
jgi:hypothetical protein